MLIQQYFYSALQQILIGPLLCIDSVCITNSASPHSAGWTGLYELGMGEQLKWCYNVKAALSSKKLSHNRQQNAVC